jgi:serine/threonine protein kinase
MALELGTTLGPYEVEALLGAGGMGEVYLALDARLGRRVAVKVLRSEFAATSGAGRAPETRSQGRLGPQSSQHLHAVRHR